jgi:hypothetical protein
MGHKRTNTGGCTSKKTMIPNSKGPFVLGVSNDILEDDDHDDDKLMINKDIAKRPPHVKQPSTPVNIDIFENADCLDNTSTFKEAMFNSKAKENTTVLNLIWVILQMIMIVLT